MIYLYYVLVEEKMDLIMEKLQILHSDEEQVSHILHYLQRSSFISIST